MRLDLVYYGNSFLRKETHRVEIFSEDLNSIVNRMFHVMRSHKGIGLAAPQIGLEAKIIVVGFPTDTVYINPEIIERSSETYIDTEGCLSLPGISAEIERSRSVVIQYQDITGKEGILNAEDYLARILFHEIDHLNKVLYIDNIPSKLKRDMLYKKVSKFLKRGKI